MRSPHDRLPLWLLILLAAFNRLCCHSVSFSAKDQCRPGASRGGTRILLLRKDSEVPASIHVLDGRHVIVDVSLRAKGGGIRFDPSYCDRTSIT